MKWIHINTFSKSVRPFDCHDDKIYFSFKKALCYVEAVNNTLCHGDKNSSFKCLKNNNSNLDKVSPRTHPIHKHTHLTVMWRFRVDEFVDIFFLPLLCFVICEKLPRSVKKSEKREDSISYGSISMCHQIFTLNSIKKKMFT